MKTATPTGSFTAFLARAAETFIARINSSNFAAAQRRRALAGLDRHQLADIGLIYTDGDYRPHPDAATWHAKSGQAEPDRAPRSLPRGAVTP